MTVFYFLHIYLDGTLINFLLKLTGVLLINISPLNLKVERNSLNFFRVLLFCRLQTQLFLFAPLKHQRLI